MKQQPPRTSSHQSAAEANRIKFEFGKRWLLFAALTCGLLWFSASVQRSVQFFQGKPPAPSVDFLVYYTAGLVARQDDNRLYSYRETADPNNPEKTIVVNPQLDIANPDSPYARVAKDVTKASLNQYLYPPFFALLVSPLTHLPFQIAVPVWYFLTYLFIGLSIFLTVKMFYKNSLTAILAAGLIMFLAEFTFPLQDLLWVGNVGAIVLFFCAAAIYLQKNNRPTLSALFIALAVFVKLTPLIIVPLMIMRRQWKWLAAFAGWSVLLLAINLWHLGWQNHREFVTKIMPAMSNGIAEHNNRSLLSVFQFIELRKVPNIIDIENGTVALTTYSNILFKMFVGLILLGVLYYSWRVNKTSSKLIAEMYSLLLLSLIVSPVSWRHGYVLTIVPLIFIWLHPLTQKWSVVELLLLTAATVSVFSVLPDYAMAVSNAFLFQILMVLVMPTGVLISIFLLLKIQRSSNDALDGNIALQSQDENA